MMMTWVQYDGALREMLRKLPRKDYFAVVGVARSGLIPAVHVAHLLKVRTFGALAVCRTTGDEQDAPKTEPHIQWSALPSGLRGRPTLVVDDIVGEGTTLRTVCDLLSARGAIVTACSVVVNLGNFKSGALDQLVDSYGLLVHEWVNFPWCV